MKRLLHVFVVFLLCVLPASAQEPKAMKGVALVIGQSKYQHITPLDNPDTDAEAVEKLLTELGFDVTGVADRDAKKLSRDFERFVEDADGADVALIYYSGHGIEAGGENYLLPIDADPATMAEDGKGLVALGPVLDELKSSVKVTIFLLDACRSNPFPAGTVIKKEGKPVELSTGGLGAPRGFAQVTQDSNESLGTVIGFAAEPGRPALDGEKGSNSPYAAAILRHLSAMPGQEFGLVMRMVTEEVYLKTKSQQRPWVNESLRTQLFFGAPEPVDSSPDGVITGERRKLLLTIADLAPAARQQVEQIAQQNGVPMDTLYGVLASLGATDIPKDPEALAKALTSQAAKIKQMLDQRKALAIDNPDLQRLVAAADKALGDGAIKSARQFLDQAKAEVEKSRDVIEDLEAQIKAKRLANGEIVARAGEAAELDFDYAAAAKDYAEAYDWVKDADKAIAAKYKTYEADALQSLGEVSGEKDALQRAIAAYEMARGLIAKSDNSVQWGKTTNNLANTYLRLGERDFDAESLRRAIGLYHEVLEVPDNDRQRSATTNSNLGIALHTLGDQTADMKLYDEAEKAFATALSLRDKTADPAGWAADVLNAANLDVTLADKKSDPQRLTIAESKIRDAIAALDPAKDRYALSQAKNNLAIVLRLQGAAKRDPELVRQSLKIYEEVLAGLDRKTFPFDWGNTEGNIAIATTNLGALTGDMSEIEKALPHFENALAEVTRERAPLFWAKVQNGYGLALQVTGFMNKDDKRVEKAADAFRHALEVRSKDVTPLDWAESQSLLASTLSTLASKRADVKLADESIAAYRAALEVYEADKTSSDYLSTVGSLASALQGKGILLQDDKVLQEAEAMFANVLDATPREKSPLDWANAMKNVATIQFMRGTTIMDKAMVQTSLKSFDLALEEYNKSGSFMDRMMVNAMRNNAEQALALFK